ncbi:unnamed protein product [Adineta steineri]|uniref:Cilia- and flagella-associated protein 126 n=1 Tax=Adineta steineri TaxID=433720 RepID=A0A818YZC3_9BILA|nr:unnamed protein product [Adineta steineri]CAF0945315.1 unnamed protein product [Adineta steineri]CAF3692116.1 unnamed protein product [Adineta steineri]CAF3757762.1 unnamed protein product [Adineta steineri]
MARNYSASQYEKSFTPKRLQMYQVPKDPQPGVHPAAIVSTDSRSFVANDHGRLLPGVERSKRSPFGEYIGTWDLPKRIPGPYHVHPMGRTEKNFSTLCAQRDETIQAMEQARTYEKDNSYGQNSS